VTAGNYAVSAVVKDAAGAYDGGYEVVEYPHIHRRQVPQAASAKVQVIDVSVAPNLRVGYVMGVGDQVPQAIAQLGARVELIGPEQLASGDLTQYDVIVTGVRAYERRPDLRANNHRLIAYAEHSPDDSEAWGKQLQAYLELADWDLLYERNDAARAEYALVHENLKTNGVAEAVIAGVFAPEVPIVLPTFRPNPLQTAIGNRYIDVTFEITKFGEPRRIEIVGVAPNVPDAAKDELVDVINTSRFRPRIADGELGRATPVAVRYYLND
jgi:hypothetical protein